MSATRLLYKYEPITIQTLGNLKRQQIHFGSPRNFNDPYDCALRPNFVIKDDADIEILRAQMISQQLEAPAEARDQFQNVPSDHLRKTIIKTAGRVSLEWTEKFLDKNGVTCFSEVNDDVVMWGHYADKSRGFCLEFETTSDFAKFMPVIYQDAMPDIDVADILLGRDPTVVQKLYCIKSTEWSYEREWRGIHDVGGTNYTYQPSQLKAVYFGTRTPQELIAIVCLILRAQNKTVRFFRGFPSDVGFRTDFKEFTYTPHLEAEAQRLNQPS